MATKFSENSETDKAEYYCETCDYKCSLKQHLKQHFLSKRHKTRVFNNVENSVNNTIKNNFICDCGKEYRERTGLWKHKTKGNCVKKTDNNQSELQNIQPEQIKLTDDNLISILIHQCKELRDENKELLGILKNGTHNVINNTNNTNNTNSHNKAFNLNFFLNETCKDAMNITDFVESIKLQLSDLERVGELGYVEGISNIIVKNLKDLDVTQRPVHCTDKKRETMYIKDEDKWEKDDEQKKMHKMVRKVADKNARMVPKFKEAHPDCGKSASRFSDQYNKIIMEAMGGRGDNDFEKEEKIIKRVSKEVIVDKEP
jgi:hypothetical protein